MKKYFKKSLSLFMAALMLMSCWVFFAPEAEAVSAGKYYYKLWAVVSDGGDGKYFKWTIRGKNNNGTANQTDYEKEIGCVLKSDDTTYTIKEGTASGFPTQIYGDYYNEVVWPGSRTMKATVHLAVGTDKDHLTEVSLSASCSTSGGSGSASASGNTIQFDCRKKHVYYTINVVSGSYPKASTVVMTKPGNVTIPTSGTKTTSFTSYVKDQYGVVIGSSSTGYSKSVSLSSNRSSTTGFKAAYGTTTDSNDPCTITVDNSAKLQKFDDNTITAKASYTFNGATVSNTQSFVATDPTYKFSFNGNGGVISPNAAVSKYYYNTLTSSEIPSTGNRAGYDFIAMYGDKKADSYALTKPTYSGALSTSTYVEGDKTWYAAWWSKNYTVTFVDLEGNEIGTTTAKYGKTLADSIELGVASLPIKVPDYPKTPGQEGTYNYSYVAEPAYWTVVESKAETGNGALPAANYGDDGANAVIAGNTTFRVKYAIEQKAYELNFNNFAGNNISKKTDYRFRDPIQYPNDQTMKADNYFTYTFKGWHKVRKDERTEGYIVNSTGYVAENETDDKATGGYVSIDSKSDSAVRENATYVPVFEKTFIEYKVNFVYFNATGTVITTEEKSYHFNDALDTPEVPESYTFDGYRHTYLANQWKKKDGTAVGAMPTEAKESATYVASYGEGVAAIYDITFKFFGTDAVEKTATSKVAHNTAVEVPEYPATYRDDSNEYTFVKWLDQEGHEFDSIGHKDAVYTAQYTAKLLYTATFMNEGEQFGNVEKYIEGEKVAAPDGTPEKAADKSASKYTFLGWFDEDGNKLGTMGGKDTVYYAKYEPTYIVYTINFVYKDANGKDVTDTKTYHYGDKITVPAEPADYQDTTYKYTFKAWDPDVSTVCADNATYTATYRREYVYYTVTWMKEDGTSNEQTNYTAYATDAHIYNEKVRMPTVAPLPNVVNPDPNHTNVLVGWEYEENGTRVRLERGYRIKSDMVFYPVYEPAARVCTVNLYDEDGTTLIQTLKVPYGSDLKTIASYSDPKKTYTDNFHYTFDKWLTMDDADANTVITADVNLKASYTEEEHTYKAGVVVDKLPTFTEEGTGTALCECGKTTATTIAVIPDGVNPTAKLFIKDVATESGEDVDTDKIVRVAPLSNLIIATDDTAEPSTYNADGKGSGVKKIEYLVSFDKPIEDIKTATGWNVRFDYDAYVEALKAENGNGELTDEQKLMLKEFESNATAYIGDLKNTYPKLADGATFYFYAKVTDENGNANYVGSNKLVYDEVAPTVNITGGGNGGSKFCVEAKVAASDNINLVSFTVNGEEKAIVEGKAEITLNTAGSYQIVAVDEAGNKTTKNITIIGEHREKLYTTAATCENDGSVVKRCTLCGEQIGEATPIKATGHNFVEVRKVEPTCVEKGYTLERCTYCGVTRQTNEVPATGGHKFGEWIVDKEATCKDNGIKHHVCSVCHEVETEEIKSTGTEHKFYRAVVTKPTCTEDGYSEHTCKYCGQTFKIEGSETEKLGHDASGVWVVTKEATCTVDGTRVQWCIRCGEDCGNPLATETIKATGHAWAFKEVVNPTETEKGYTLYECMICHETMKANETPVLVPRTVTFVDEDGKTVLAKLEKKYAGDAITSALVAEPTKPADETYRYTFNGWVDEEGKSVTLPVIVGDKDITLKATYESRFINYTVTFYKEDTQFKKVGYLHYGEKHTASGPSDYEDAMYNYTFAGWVKRGEIAVLEDYTDGDGNVVKANVSKTITVTADETQEYTAVYAKTLKQYNVVFAYSYDKVITNFVVDAGTTASFPSSLETPVKAADETFHYTFSGWKGDSLENITKDTLAIAEFTSELHTRGTAKVVKKATCTESGITEYPCTKCGYVETVVTPATGHSWSTTPDADGNLVCTTCGEKKDSGIRYTVSFYTEGESDLVLVKTIGFLKKGAVLTDSQIPTPTKADTETKTYVFKGWYKKGDATKTPVEITKTITENAEYVAIFEETERTFKVIYAIDSDNVLQIISDVKGGSKLPEYTGAEPTSDKFDDYGHDKFYGWSKEASDFPKGITEDVYITAVFISEDHDCKSVSMRGATCTKPMEETFKCSKCGYTYTKTSGKAKGHSYALVETVEPTSTKEGYELYKCSVCGDEYKKIIAPKTYIFFTVIVKDQDGNPVQGAKVSIFDGTKFIASGTTDADGKVVFRVEEAKNYRVVVEYDNQHIEGDITVNPDGSTSGDNFNVHVTRCSCTCHRDGVWPSIFRFFHKIIKMLVGHFVCCGEPDARYGS